MGTTWDNVLAKRWWALGCFVRQKEPAPSAEASPNQPRSVWQFREPQAWAADGKPLYVGTRVQTQWTREEGGDDRWYAGSVSAVLASGEVTIKYDDGDEWTGSAMDVRLLNSTHPLKSGSCVEQIWDMVFQILGRTLGCLARENLLGPLLAMIMFVIPFLLCAFGDRRTGEIALWFKLDSCLSKTTPAFVYTLRAAAAAGARGGFQPQALLSPLPSSSLSP